MKLDYGKITNVEVDGIDTNDYPDFPYAYIATADYNGVAMTEEQIEVINSDGDYVYQKLIEQTF